MLNGVKSGVNTHLDPRIGSCMYAALDASSVAFVNCRVQLFLRQFRNMGTVSGQHFHPFRAVTHLLADLFSYFPWSVHFFHFVPCMAAGHADTGRHITHRRDAPFKCGLRMLQRIQYDQLRTIVKGIRLGIIISQMGVHVAQSRKKGGFPVILDFLLRIRLCQFLFGRDLLNLAVLCQNCLVFENGLAVPGHQILCTNNHCTTTSFLLTFYYF